jgi:hypothetical protein
VDDELYGYRRHDTSMSKSADAIELTIREVLSVIDQSFAKAGLLHEPQWRSLHKKATQRALIAYAADEVFRNNTREALRGFAVALKVRPMATALQRTTAVLALRAAVGHDRFDSLRTLFGRHQQ